ncbi:YeeE/YedE family protein [Aestuariivirga litoralis]|uniref:YeeE/YedE family protein n=1 Tax=Aestuariivirga litoralis TaxID=2650924 RepID=UPI0018C6BAE0|nr:YeeE/YedE thiosulfate transporter family protein [Aestuariivirga litoralis]MBG1233020.1 YeeE/YedE family protein [Aestuariivirga litoralis]
MNVTLYTPGAGLAGGILIGLSAVLLLASAGRIAGCSGIFRKLLTLNFTDDSAWRAIFIAGLLIGAYVAGPHAANAQNLSFVGLPALVIGGVLVGFGTALAHGCTSGHGICGLARFSMRSLVATCTFMVVAIITVFITRHVLGG